LPKTFEPVRIGVVGLGRFGRLHSLTVAGLTEAELVAVVARRQSSIDVLRRDLPDVSGWTDLSRAVAESRAEAWIVACSTPAHVPITEALLEAGKTVLLEKPIANTLPEAESLAPLVRPDSANLMIGHIVLFNSEFRQLKDEVKRRGGLCYIDCVRHRPASIVHDFPGENPLQATMVHDLYAAQVLVDRADPVRCSAQFHRTATGRVDVALAQLQWADGMLGSFAASYITPAGMAPRGFDRMEVFGRDWAIRISPNPRPVELWDDRAAAWPMALEIRADPSGPTGMMAEELRCFCRVVRGLQAVPIGASYTDAIQVQRWMDRLVVAAESV
jgi:predicted dehydrogenase